MLKIHSPLFIYSGLRQAATSTETRLVEPKHISMQMRANATNIWKHFLNVSGHLVSKRRFLYRSENRTVKMDHAADIPEWIVMAVLLLRCSFAPRALSLWFESVWWLVILWRRISGVTVEIRAPLPEVMILALIFHTGLFKFLFSYLF